MTANKNEVVASSKKAEEPDADFHPAGHYLDLGFREERDYFIENLSLLISSGMDILSAIAAVSPSFKTKKMKGIVSYMEKSVKAGFPLWQAFDKTGLFPNRTISLLRSGEEAGRLPEHLDLITKQLRREKILESRVLSALTYPSIVLLFAFIIGMGSVWFVLPNLIAVFNESHTALPLTTRILVWIGTILRSYGLILVPGAIACLMVLIYAFFVSRRFRFIGDYIIFHIPGVNRFVRGIELSRFGYILGELLQAGFQLDEAFESVKDSTDYASYREFYTHIQENIEKGETFRQAFASHPESDKFIPQPIQQLIFSAEKSGALPETFLKISSIYEEKTESLSRDLSSVLEPIVLILVGLVVCFVVMAIISPIYDLSNQI